MLQCCNFPVLEVNVNLACHKCRGICRCLEAKSKWFLFFMLNTKWAVKLVRLC